MKQPYFSERALKGKQSMAFFPKISSINFEKSEVVTTIFFFDSDSCCNDLRFPHSHKPLKNSVLLEGKFLKKPDNENRDVQNICAETKGGTVFKFGA